MGIDDLVDVDGLGQLTRREAEIIHLRCQGLKIEAIAAQLDPPITPRAVYFHLGNIYEKLGLAGVDGYERLRILNAQICPRVVEASSSASHAPADEEGHDQEAPNQPAEAIVALVVYDEARALIPPSLALAPTSELSHPIPNENTFVPIGGRPMIGMRRRLKDALLLIAGAVFGILLALALALPQQMTPAGAATPAGLGSPPPTTLASELSHEVALHASRIAGTPPRP